MGKPAVKQEIDSAAMHRDMANAIRALAMDAVEKAKSGHPGMPMGMADVATVLFTQFLKFDAAAPDWPDRDRFVLSAGHGSMLLYALLHLTGYPGMSMEELSNFRQLGSKTAGHPEYGHAPGIETTTGPLGQGLANAVGMALAERLINARLGDAVVDHFTYVIAGDGCLMEGISHEAISLAGHLKLNKLIVLFDDNSISIDGATSLSVSDDQIARFKASGWNAVWIDGHDPAAIAFAIEGAQRSDRPTLIACKTVIGYGAPTKQGKASTHGEPLGAEEIKGAREKLGWAQRAFRAARRRAGGVACSGIAWQRAAQGLGKVWRASSIALNAPAGRSGRRRRDQGPCCRHRRDQGGVCGDAAEDRNARGLAEGAREARSRFAQPDRRLGGPHRLQRHAHQASHRRSRPATTPATTFTTAYASTPWHRP